MMRRARLAAAANIQHDRAEFGGGGARPARRGWNRHLPAADIDPLLRDGSLVPLFRDKAIGKAADYLVQPPASRSAAARTVADWLVAEGASRSRADCVKRRAERTSPIAARRQGRQEDRRHDSRRRPTRSV